VEGSPVSWAMDCRNTLARQTARLAFCTWCTPGIPFGNASGLKDERNGWECKPSLTRSSVRSVETTVNLDACKPFSRCHVFYR
jgi:hypothetical protein